MATAVTPTPRLSVRWVMDRLSTLPTTWRLVLRWTFLIAVVLLAFWESLLELWRTTVGGGLGGYAWTVPTAAALAAFAVARRNRNELPIHDRQTDIIVGIMCLNLAVMIKAVLMPRYQPYFYLLRLDLVALWAFVLGASIVLFGLRPVTRYTWIWLMTTAIFPLPYFLAVILLGGGNVAAGGATLAIAAGATAISVGRTAGRALVGAVGSLVVGLLLLGAMAVFTPNARLWVFQIVPATTAMILVGVSMFFLARIGLPKHVLRREVQPLAAGQIWSGIPLVLAFAVVLSSTGLPPLPQRAPVHPQLQIDRPLQIPPGWRVTETSEYDWVQRLYGDDSRLLRQRVVAETGNPDWDKFGRPRTIMVDQSNPSRPYAFRIYPISVLYDLVGTRVSESYTVDLGHGITGQMATVVDDELLVTWTALSWRWTDDRRAQQVMLISVDNHEDWAPFPQPTGGLVATLTTLLTVLFRGNAAVTDQTPQFKDADMLTEFGRALVAEQLSRPEATV